MIVAAAARYSAWLGTDIMVDNAPKEYKNRKMNILRRRREREGRTDEE
jgi:hypothetical protein